MAHQTAYKPSIKNVSSASATPPAVKNGMGYKVKAGKIVQWGVKSVSWLGIGAETLEYAKEGEYAAGATNAVATWLQLDSAVLAGKGLAEVMDYCIASDESGVLG